MKEFIGFHADSFLDSLHDAKGLRFKPHGNPGDASNEIQSSKPFEPFCFECFLNHKEINNNKDIKRK